MKRILAFIFLVVFLAGCRSFDVIIKDDPFKKATTVTADMWHKVIDSKIDNQRMLYEKNINNGKVSIPTVSFQFYAIIHPVWGYNGEDLEKQVIILCNNNNFKVNIAEYRKLDQRNVHGSGNTDAVGNYSASVNTLYTSTITGKFLLMPDVQNAILNCKEYMIRFYFGNTPLTLKATSEQLVAVKKFISTNASSIKKNRLLFGIASS